MGSARQDYQRFVRWLHDPRRQAPEDARRFASLVLENFDTVANTSRQRSQRSFRLATIARSHLAAASQDIPALAQIEPEDDWPWQRLNHLIVGPFRGFCAEQPFNLSNRLVLCYGPNGSGKSSLCEALEFSLLGQVEEADTRRLTPQQYLANIHAGRYAPPILTATEPSGNEVEVRANPEMFRFCFIEKNRIDAFSRIAARPSGQRAELIATLFGMDQFNEFASHFNESMDQALTLGDAEQTNLAQKRAALQEYQDTVDNEPTEIQRLELDAAQYAEVFQAGLSYVELRALVADSDPPSRLQQLENQLNAVPSPLVGVSRESLAKMYARADMALQNEQESAQLFEERRNQVNFHSLYSSVQALQEETPDHCPACLTPLAETTENPFERASQGIKDLKEIAELQENCLRLNGELGEASRALRDELQKVLGFLEASDDATESVAAYITSLPSRPESNDWWVGGYTTEVPEGEIPVFEQILAVADEAARQDEQSNVARCKRQPLIDERDRLNDVRLWIQRHELARQRVIEDAATARARIERFETENAELIVRAEQEAENNVRDFPIKAAYDSFIDLLRCFRNELPGMLMEDLNQVAMDLYNEFNQTDPEADKLTGLFLPLTGEDRIEINFRGEPDRGVDALAVLSEGHIRCLGLAILLAKALNVRAPLIVFDDAINAIDHDHRSGIRSTLFESERFRQVQIIVTCHSQEFIKDVQNHLPVGLRADCQEYLLLYHAGDHQPRVRPDVGSLNYLARANEAMERLDPRDALSLCRKALEMLTTKSWKWLASHQVGELSVLISGPGRDPTLRNLCEALRSQMTRLNHFDHGSKQPLIDGLTTILGIPGGSLVWTYLNGGTHEEPDRDDFDREHVATVIRVLEGIDALELRQNR